MSAPNPRKRAAPDASPMVPYQQRTPQPFAAETLNGVADPLMWNADGDDLVNASAHPASSLGLMPPKPECSPVPSPSNSLTRRDMNQALVPAHGRNFDTSIEPWTSFGGDNALLQRNDEGGAAEQDNIDALEEMSQKAKREAQNKRKSIPPFVQKLSSFLEERKNEDLIRWSEKGDSFIVMDEDEFAKTLIPELFKHNNYASFVRQLNMYGFHKRVGLSDNSMRASERKNKSPSEYHNPFFRRGHPNLLWLINKPKGKPKSANSKSKGNEAEGDSDDEQINEDMVTQTGAASNTPAGRSLPAAPSDPHTLPKKELTLIREELHRVREQQGKILRAINQLQHNNNDLYNQALMFQSQHDRHQNSINAILKFLANVFRKTLEDHGNMQSVSDIISSMITNQGQQQPHQGSVFDLGDLFHSDMDGSATTPPGSAPKKARGLLPPIPNRADVSNPAQSPAPSTPYYPVGNQNPEMGHVTELVDGVDTPSNPNLRHELEKNPHERMMKIINDHNATNKSGMDLPEAAKLVANAPSALNREQRSTLADFIATQSTSLSSGSSSTTAPQSAVGSAAANGAAAPAATKSGLSPAPTDYASMPSMSPIMKSPQMAPPSLSQINTNQMDLDQLQRLQSEQDAKIHELSEMLGPLSPSGRIPGLGDGQEGYFDPPNVDLDQYFDSNAFLSDANFGADGNDFNFSIDEDAAAGADPLGVDIGINGKPSPSGTEEIRREDLDDDGVLSSKRRKVA
ncbi:uncharacterized protein UV8b_06164 [Ustilaginoidea virens]|uniref:HSF-type DNA-binding domain-containing protein n=1 Tax=Ustilaginoidea virens TaxID=1159556 RepID=A0A8E5HV79_USTVR|nr:uncharacterized protein UV8b_06164 [Ustilaginoidea virens]QUC21923.1 hypothetical protein UV8b_06164 [Ustilaginoidea virens]